MNLMNDAINIINYHRKRIKIWIQDLKILIFIVVYDIQSILQYIITINVYIYKYIYS